MGRALPVAVALLLVRLAWRCRAADHIPKDARQQAPLMGAATWPEASERCASRGGLLGAHAIGKLGAMDGFVPAGPPASDATTLLWAAGDSRQQGDENLPDCRVQGDGAAGSGCAAVAVNRTSRRACATSDACHHRHEFLCAAPERPGRGMRNRPHGYDRCTIARLHTVTHCPPDVHPRPGWRGAARAAAGEAPSTRRCVRRQHDR
jgi:hypothetical protein